MAGASGNWVKLRKGVFKGTSLYLSASQRQRLLVNYGADSAAIVAALEGDTPSGLRDALEYMGDRERPTGAAKPTTSFSAKVETSLNAAAAAALADIAASTKPPQVTKVAAPPALSLGDKVQSQLISDWSRVSGMLLGGSYEGNAPTANDFADSEITVGSDGQVQLTTYTSSAQMYITYNATVDPVTGSITALKYAYAEPRDYALGDTETYTPMSEYQARMWMQKYA
jgi:hypothetical protein